MKEPGLLVSNKRNRVVGDQQKGPGYNSAFRQCGPDLKNAISLWIPWFCLLFNMCCLHTWHLLQTSFAHGKEYLATHWQPQSLLVLQLSCYVLNFDNSEERFQPGELGPDGRWGFYKKVAFLIYVIMLHTVKGMIQPTLYEQWISLKYWPGRCSAKINTNLLHSFPLARE